MTVTAAPEMSVEVTMKDVTVMYKHEVTIEDNSEGSGGGGEMATARVGAAAAAAAAMAMMAVIGLLRRHGYA